MKHLIIGALAHVDAGKTTLNESLLYTTGTIRKLGRVDHKDAFLDYDMQERNRGITIYAKEARFTYKDSEFTIIDTPGHIDFATEMERALQTLDYAILVISGSDGVESHTKTIWNLLSYYHIPTFIFVNKMDIAHKSKEELINEIQKELSSAALDFQVVDYEAIAMLDDSLLDEYLTTNMIRLPEIQALISQRALFPIYFGSALKLDGIEALLEGMDTYMQEPIYSDHFGAFVYKISKDEKGVRLTHMKVTGGKLSAKQVLNDEKIDQIRLYNGTKYDMVQELAAGSVCAIKGLENSKISDTYGEQKQLMEPQLSSYMSYRVIVNDNVDNIKAYSLLQELNDEDSSLHISFDEATKEIRVHLMGEVQHEVLAKLIEERFKLHVSFDFGRIAYKETITAPVEGVGHFEPLRHYAEVHLLLEPLPLGSGIVVANECSGDMLNKNYRNQVLHVLETKRHRGVLGGYPLTDVRITLMSGRAHEKHTEGGDFYEATRRAVRHGLKMTTSIILEPFYDFYIEIPNDFISRVTYDLDQMHAKYTVESDVKTIIRGSAPIRLMQSYQTTLAILSKGLGVYHASFKDYEPTEDEAEILKDNTYDSERDLRNPTGSVFCAHGAGFYVPYNEVTNYMHLPSIMAKPKEYAPVKHNRYTISDEELDRVITRTFGPQHTKLYHESERKRKDESVSLKDMKKPCMIVDGYNLIHAWDRMNDLMGHDIYNAREELIGCLNNYQGFKNNLLIVVFDAYKVKENPGRILRSGNIYVVYTKESETADTYIEKTTHDLGSRYDIKVVTSDGAEQMIILGNGAHRVSTREFILEYDALMEGFHKEYNEASTKTFNMALSDIRKVNEED